MIPVISKARTETNDGLWTNKMGGDFEEGDPALTKFIVEGRADIKELGGHLRIFFTDIILKKRVFVLTEAIRTKLLEDYYVEKKRKKQAAYSLLPDAVHSDSDEDDDEEEKKRKEKVIVDGLVEIERMKPLQVPKLHLYLTTKKPKVRMVDAHTHGAKIRITGVKDSEGIFGNDFALSRYEASLTDIPDALAFQGLVVMKLPESEPVTAEPVIYGIVKLQSHRTQKVRTSDALHLNEIAETLAKIMNSKLVKLDHARKDEAEAAPATLKQKKELEHQKADKGAAGGQGRTSSPNPSGDEIVVSKDVHDRVKPLHVYRQLANKVWADYQRAQSDEIDFYTFLRFIDHIDIFLVTTQARRIFDAVDVGGRGMMGMSEFENFLIALDILGGASSDLIVMDAFDSLKSLPLAALQKMKEREEKRKQEEVERRRQEAMDAVIQGKGKAAAVADAAKAPSKGDAGSPPDSPGGPGAGTPLKDAAGQAAKAMASKATALAADSAAPKEKKRPVTEPGLDYSAFTEAVQLLGVKEEDDDILREAFCFGGGIREKDADKKLLSLPEFRKAWLKLADVEQAMTSRGLKYESGVFAEGRNRERLTRAIAEVEETYLANLQKISRIVEHIKQERRQKKDQRRRDQEAYREKLLHEAKKFMAVRSQEKRLKMKREQEERSKKRLEDKVLRNKLQLQQQEQQALQRAEIADAQQRKERLRRDEIRALGLDQIDYSVQKLRVVPPALYSDQDAQYKLSYALSVDFSHNVLDCLPGKDFLYWLTEARLVKFSQNRLKTLPEDIRQMAHLEILELNTNRLESLPESLAQLTTLQRLDVSNNKLEALPGEIGLLRLLRNLRAHSNRLTALPKTIGDCAKLEYLDISNNKLVELPEAMQHLASLTHLNMATNRVTSFPYHIGECMNLAYLDASTNALTFIPPSFSALNKLEYCDLENNEIVTTANCFNNLTSLRYLNMRVNAARVLHGDMGNMRNLTMLDVSMNAITSLPVELGMLRSLQELKLHRNQLVTLPPELGSCGLLQRLELPYNRLEGSLPETIGLVTSLVHLDIAFNSVDSLPRSIVGLQLLQSINAERCLLSSLPDTFTYLDKLEVLELPNNRFTRFPIELHLMKGLKQLNLANNALTLLPRKINMMTNLQSLNLSRNQLRALPVEFTEVLECVSVQLESNPWTDLPPRWGKLWPGARATDGADGYSLSDAVDFLYGMRAFYDTAEQVWEELGVFHCAQKLALDDFVQEIRLRIPKTWHDGLVEYVKHVYFSARKTGVFPRWYELDDATALDNALRVAAAEQKRDEQVVNSRLDLERRHRYLQEVYGQDLRRRARHALERAQEAERNNEVKHRVVFNNTRATAVKAERVNFMRQQVRERNFAQRTAEEGSRLQEILDADKEGREEDRLAAKKKRKQPYKLSDLHSFHTY